jgi:hypothetical protein
MKNTIPLLTALLLAPLAALPAAQLNSRDFANPPPDNRPAMLWFWKDTKMTPVLIDEQLDLIKSVGIYRVNIFQRGPSGASAYADDEWYPLMEYTLRAAEKRGMRIWLACEGRASALPIVTEGGRMGGKDFPPRPDLRPNSINFAAVNVNSGQVVDLRKLCPEFADTDKPPALRDGALAVPGGKMYLMSSTEVIGDGKVAFDVNIPKKVKKLRPIGVVNPALSEPYTLTWMLRAAGEGNGYMFTIRSVDATKAQLQINVIKDWNISLRRTVSFQMAVESGKTYRVENRLNGATITVLLDGEKVYDFTDDTFAAGRIGFYTPSGQLMVDNMEIQPKYGPTRTIRFDVAGQEKLFGPDLDRDSVVVVAAVPSDRGLAGAVDCTQDYTQGRAWDSGKESWKIFFFAKRPWSPRGYGVWFDNLNPEAGARFTDAVYGSLKRNFGWAVGTVLEGILDDEPLVPAGRGEVPWSPGIQNILRQEGHSPAKTLPALFGDFGQQGSIERGAFWRAFSGAWSEGWYGPQADWCEANGLQLVSNPPGENHFPGSFYHGGNFQVANQKVQVPGIDVVFDELLPGQRSLNPRQAVSLANVFGRKKVMTEVFGAFGWWVKPETCKFVLGSMAVRGANLPEIHGFWSNYANPKDIPFPPTFDPNNPWWPVMDEVVTLAGRFAVLNEGKNVKDVAVLIPDRAVEGSLGKPLGKTSAADGAFQDCVYSLEDSQVDFDVLTEAFFDSDPAIKVKAKVEGGKIVVGEATYSVLVVPEADKCSLETIQLANRLAEQGGSVVRMGKGPTTETNGRDSELAAQLNVLAGKDKFFGCADMAKLKSIVREQKWPDVALQPANDKIRVLHRRTENADAYLLFNEGETAFAGVGEFHKVHTQGTPQIWDADNGKVFEVETKNGAVKLHLDPYQLLAVVFTKDSPGGAPQWVDVAARITGATPIKINTGWTFKFDKPGNEPKPIELGDWTAMDPKFSGTGVYACEFILSGDNTDGKQWLLDLGEVKDVAEVEINGQKAGRLLWRPYRLDVGKYLRPGLNKLIVRVTNTRANSRGDRRASGLLGPVQLK